ncbi:MAG: M14 family metallocarboxypeptidase, partial [Alphaproteobacteria bacterium]|nr:M14 family metallocarboxypeptidase [Alphaproteobacteria bacterium]
MMPRPAVLPAIAATVFALGIGPASGEFDPAKGAAEPAAVAARFPDPPVTYDTPAFAPGKPDFTSQPELMAYAEQLKRRTVQLRLRIAGHSQQGRDIPLLVFTEHGMADAAAVRANGRATALIIGQQHGNEPAGGEAALALARRLSDGDLRPLLARLNVLVLPRANPDGAAMFVRVSADGTDLNRDHLLLTTPEVRAIAAVMRDYRPDLVIDAHEFTVMGRWVDKFDAVQSYDALIQYATVANLPESLTKASQEWFYGPAIAALRREQLSPSWYFTTSPSAADKTVSMGGVQPDTGRNVAGLRNAVSFLIETRGVGLGRAHLARRVHTSEVAMAAILESAAAHEVELRALTRAAGKAVSR